MDYILKKIKCLFCVGDDKKVTEKSLSRLMLSSILGIVVCVICLAGLTWAWFSGSATSSANVITAASFSTEVEFSHNGSAVIPEIENGFYKLDSGVYIVKVTAKGNVSTGYCTIELKSADNTVNTYHTVQLYPVSSTERPESVTFSIQVSNVSYLKISSLWGRYLSEENEILVNNSENEIFILPNSSSSLSETET